MASADDIPDTATSKPRISKEGRLGGSLSPTLAISDYSHPAGVLDTHKSGQLDMCMEAERR